MHRRGWVVYSGDNYPFVVTSCIDLSPSRVDLRVTPPQDYQTDQHDEVDDGGKPLVARGCRRNVRGGRRRKANICHIYVDVVVGESRIDSGRVRGKIEEDSSGNYDEKAIKRVAKTKIEKALSERF
jgi:hypothetical protein